MPAIDTTSNKPAATKRRVRVRPKPKAKPYTLPKTFKPANTQPAPKVKPVVKAKPTPYVLPKKFRTEGNVSGGHKRTQEQDEAVNQNVAHARKDVATKDRRVQQKAKERFGIKGQQEAVDKAKRDLADLYQSDPKAYKERVDKANESPLKKAARVASPELYLVTKAQGAIIKSPVGDVAKKTGKEVEKAAAKGAEGLKAAQEFARNQSRGGRHQAARMGLAPDTSNLGREAADIVATTPTSVYMTGKAAQQAASGNTKPAKELLKDFKNTSALAPLASGNIKEAAKRAEARPLSTALELSGGRALLGRGAGAAMRTGALGKTAKRAGSVERENLRLTNARPGEGPEVGQRYSKDAMVKAAQVISERRRARKGEDPNVARQPRKVNITGTPQRIAPSIGPLKNRLDDRVDRHVHAGHVMQQQAMGKAEKAAKKAHGKDANKPIMATKAPGRVSTLQQHIKTDLRNPPVELPQQAHTPAPLASPIEQARHRAAQGAMQTSMRAAVKDFAFRPNGKHFVEHKDAKAAAISESKRLGEPMIPINESRLMRPGSKDPLPMRDASVTPGVRMATMQERAWRAAKDDHRNGKWVLMPERVVGRYLQHAETGRNYGALQRSTNLFKDVVLTTSNPVRWLGGNVADLTFRSAMEGLTPADLYRGAKVYKELGKYGRRGSSIKASTMGGGFGHLARDVSDELAKPGVGHAVKVWGRYRAGVYGLESAIESLPQLAVVGKELRTGKSGRGSGVRLNQGLKGLLRATDEQVQHFAKNMVTDTATEMRIASHVEDVIGKWGKLSPEARKALAYAPFAQWLGAATKYVLITMPAKHPVKTGILAGLNQMTEDERRRLGFSRFEPLGKQVQDYQMSVLPQKVGKDKYGPVVKGTDMARALSFGTVNDAMGLNVGGYLFPQFQGALNAANGTSWTGEQLRYPEGDPNAGMPLSVEDRRKTAIGMLAETMIPFGSMYRRIVQEKGSPSLPQSTILDPQVRLKYNPQTKQMEKPKGSTAAGIKKVTGSPIPGLPQPKRVYTKGAVNQIERSRTAISEVKRWNEERKAAKGKGYFWDDNAPAPTPTPTATPKPKDYYWK